jgi:hypothetical protein
MRALPIFADRKAVVAWHLDNPIWGNVTSAPVWFFRQCIDEDLGAVLGDMMLLLLR